MGTHTAHVTKSVWLSVGAYVSRVWLPLFRLALVLSLKPWLRRFPAAPAEPRGGTSLPAVDILADGPGSLVERKEGGRGEEQDNVYVGCLIYWEHWDTSSPQCEDSDRRVTLHQEHRDHAATRQDHTRIFLRSQLRHSKQKLIRSSALTSQVRSKR